MARLVQDKLVADFLVSEAEGYRSRDTITVPQGAAVFSSGALMTLAGAAATAANVDAILMYPADPREGPVSVTVITRDAEVNDAYLGYGALDRNAVNARLKTLNIIVRRGVLSQSIVTPSSAENLDSITP